MNKINTKEQIITSFMSTEISEQHLRGFLKVYFKFNYKLLYNLYNLTVGNYSSFPQPISKEIFLIVK